MSRGGSFGGGQSSLNYLFESEEKLTSTKFIQPNSKPPASVEDGKNKDSSASSLEIPINNNYHRAEGQNSGNFITGRPSTRVQSAPGGDSSLGYLFGKK